jgi:hypothetical protein
VAECVRACEAMGEQAGLKLIGELELTGMKNYENQHDKLVIVLESRSAS